MAKLFDVGKIVNTHGIHGEVKVEEITDNKERFSPGELVFIETDHYDLKPLTIVHTRPHKNHQLITFEEVTTLSEAEALKGKYIKVKEEQLPSLKQGEYYIYQILNCEVYTMDNEFVGNVTNILKTGANDVWVITSEEGQEYLIPFIKDVVKEINVEEGKIKIEVMEGLLD